VLFYDAGGDGKITQKREYVFTEWDPTAKDDMAALRARFDTNNDGKLTALDTDFSKFKVMVTQADGSQVANASLSAMHASPGGQRMADILALVLHHDEQAIFTAVEPALTEGVPTKTHVLNLLHRPIDGKVVRGPPLDTPPALALHREPKANVERHDGLRSQIAGGCHAS